MIITLYTKKSCSSSRKTRRFLEENGIDFTIHNMESNMLSFEQLKDILRLTDNGLEDILSTISKDYKEFVERGGLIEDMTLSQLYELLKDYPRMLKTPITVRGDVLFVGYSEDGMATLKNRNNKTRSFDVALKRARELDNEDAFLKNEVEEDIESVAL